MRRRRQDHDNDNYNYDDESKRAVDGWSGRGVQKISVNTMCRRRQRRKNSIRSDRGVATVEHNAKKLKHGTIK
jgi:hypothetical protein